MDRLIKTSKSLEKQVNELRSQKISEESIARNEKIGIQTELFIKHPFIENKLLPVFIANFILMDYGSGAIYGCPAHDQRDLDFANKYNLEVIQVINPSDNSEFDSKNAFTGNGKLMNSQFLNELSIEDAKQEIIKKIEKLKKVEPFTKFKFSSFKSGDGLVKVRLAIDPQALPTIALILVEDNQTACLGFKF